MALVGVATLGVGGWLLWPRLRGSELLGRWFGGGREDAYTLPFGFSDQAVRIGPDGGAIGHGLARLVVPAGALGAGRRWTSSPPARYSR